MVIIYSVVENCVAQENTSLLSDIAQKTNDFLENVTKTSALGLISLQLEVNKFNFHVWWNPTPKQHTNISL